MAERITAVGETSGSKAQNIEWFSSDLKRNQTTKFRVNIALDTSVVIEITKDSGTTWVTLNGGVALVLDSEYTFDIPIRTGDLFNIRIPTGGGATVHWCRIDRINTEG